MDVLPESLRRRYWRIARSLFLVSLCILAMSYWLHPGLAANVAAVVATVLGVVAYGFGLAIKANLRIW